jgi:hypothetical protein
MKSIKKLTISDIDTEIREINIQQELIRVKKLGLAHEQQEISDALQILKKYGYGNESFKRF